MKPENAPPFIPSKAEYGEGLTYPKSIVVTRKDETLDGRKMIVVKTVKKYGGGREEATDEAAMFLLDDKTLMMGSRAAIAQSLENKSASRNQTARNLIAKSPDALVAFGVALDNIDLEEFSKVFGEQKTAWQVFGALSSTGSDLTLETTVEKTNRPLKLTAKLKPNETSDKPAIPLVSKDDAISDLLDLAAKSIVGIEGKFTVRFEKKKAVTMLENVPEILRRLPVNNQNSTNKSRK